MRHSTGAGLTSIRSVGRDDNGYERNGRGPYQPFKATFDQGIAAFDRLRLNVARATRFATTPGGVGTFGPMKSPAIARWALLS